MNSVLVSIGVVIVVALFTALVGPFLIDWNGYRSLFEVRLSEAIGRPVVIDGDLDVRLLPIPAIRAEQVAINARSSEGGMALLVAPLFRASIPLAPLLRGQLRVTELYIDQPVIQVFWRGDGELHIPGLSKTDSAGIEPDSVSLGTLEIANGTVVVRDETLSEIKTLTHFNLIGEAGSLSGPFRAEGGVMVDGQVHAFRVGTGRLQDNGVLKTKFVLRPANGAYELAADGDFGLPEGRPSFVGKVRIGREAVDDDQALSSGLPWRVSADVAAEPTKLAFSKMALGLGPQDRAVNLTGGLLIDLQHGASAKAALSARQVDLDRALAGQPGQQASVQQAIRMIYEGLALSTQLPFPLDLSLSADAAVLNGGLVEDIALDAQVDRGALKVDKLSLLLPGKSHVAAAGSVSLKDDAPLLFADVSLTTRQAAIMADWLGVGDLRLGALQIKPGTAEITAEGKLRADRGGFSLDELTMSIDDSRIKGGMSLTGSDNYALNLNLNVDRLDLDRYASIASSGDEKHADMGALFDVLKSANIRLHANALRLGGVEALDLVGDVALADGALVVNSLALGDLAGTSLGAQGRIDDLLGQAQGKLQASMTSEDLTGAAQFAADLGLFAGDAETLATQARALSPAAFELTLTAARAENGTTAQIAANGVGAGTRMALDLAFDGKLAALAQGKVNLKLTAANSDGRQLARQMGLRLPPAASAVSPADPAASLDLTFNGPLFDDAALKVDAAMLGSRLAAKGTARLAREDNPFSFDGALSLRTADARPLLHLLDLPGGALRDPLDSNLKARVEGRQGKWQIDALEGAVAGNTLAGALTLSEPALGSSKLGLSGALDFDRIDVGQLLAVFLGEQSLISGASEGRRQAWPEGAFDLDHLQLFSGNVALTGRRLILAGVPPFGETKMTLAMGQTGFGLTDISANLLGGRMTGRLDISRRPAGALLRSSLQLEDLPLERAVWTQRDSAVATGTLQGAIQVSGEGRSWLGLISSLGGEGSITLSDGALRGLDPESFRKIIAAADAGLDLDEAAVMDAFRGYLAAGTLPYERLEGIFAITDGVASAKNVGLTAPGADVRVSGWLDLHQMKVHSEWQMAPANPENLSDKEQVGILPPVSIVFSGPLQEPKRTLNVNALTGFLTVRRLEQDVKRLEAAQADALERDRLDRMLLRMTQERIKRIRTAREQAEREAKEAEDKRLRDEAEQRAREEAERLAREAPRIQAVPADPSAPPLVPQGISGAAIPSIPPPPVSAGSDIIAPTPFAAEEKILQPDARQKTLEQIVEDALRNSAPEKTDSVATGSIAPEPGVQVAPLPPPIDLGPALFPNDPAPETVRAPAPAPAPASASPPQREADTKPKETRPTWGNRRNDPAAPVFQ